ncbi:MAG: PASTA domain-containing protein, partial [Anaerolineae bacterium]|nr:PASTA domain-containing protein [Anaerolineae bacterium]
DNLSKTARALNLPLKDRDVFLEIMASGNIDDYDTSSAIVAGFIAAINKVDSILTIKGWNNLHVADRVALVNVMRNRGPNAILLENDVQRVFWDDMREYGGLYWTNVGHILSLNPAITPEDAVEVIYEPVWIRTGNFFITGRTVKGCFEQEVAEESEDWLVFEGHIPEASGYARIEVEQANRLVDLVGTQMIESLSSPSRFDYEELSLDNATFVQNPAIEAILQMPDDDPYNVELSSLQEIDAELVTSLKGVFGVETRKEALALAPFQLRSGIGLTESQVRALRSQLLGDGPLPEVDPTVEFVVVPNVVGLFRADAAAKLDEVDLVVSDNLHYRVAATHENVVLGQVPVAGTWAKKAQEVTLTIATSGVEVPDVMGQQENDALETLKAASLKPVTTVKMDAGVHGTVIDMFPKPGTVVARNSEVVLTITHLTLK